jgi:pyrimidine 5'-nucleotidase
MPLELVFFDLDGTLYPEKNGLWMAIKQRINGYLAERMGFSSEEAQKKRQDYVIRYGTTLRGLQVEHNIDRVEYLAYVHDLPLDKYLRPDPRVRKMLEQIQEPKWIFTNSDQLHVNRVLKFLELENLFDGIIDIYALDFFCKPDQRAYFYALEIASASQPEKCILIDDSPENIRVASKIGFKTVYVYDPEDISKPENELAGNLKADFAIRELIDLQEILPRLQSEQQIEYH